MKFNSTPKISRILGSGCNLSNGDHIRHDSKSSPLAEFTSTTTNHASLFTPVSGLSLTPHQLQIMECASDCVNSIEQRGNTHKCNRQTMKCVFAAQATAKNLAGARCGLMNSSKRCVS